MRFWLGLLLTVVVFSLLVKLGFWQLSRGEAKQQVEHELSQRENQEPMPLFQVMQRYENQPVTGLLVTSEIKPEKQDTFILDNQTYEGKVGYLAYQIVQDGGGQYFLLERGFIAGTRDRSVLPKIEWLTAPQFLVGRLYQKSTNPLSSGLDLESTHPLRIQNLNIPAISEHFNIELEPFVFQPQLDNWPYPQPWQPVPMQSAKHFGYAVQWFSMAVVFAILSCYVLVRSLRLTKKKANTREPTKLEIKDTNHKDMI